MIVKFMGRLGRALEALHAQPPAPPGEAVDPIFVYVWFMPFPVTPSTTPSTARPRLSWRRPVPRAPHDLGGLLRIWDAHPAPAASSGGNC